MSTARAVLFPQRYLVVTSSDGDDNGEVHDLDRTLFGWVARHGRLWHYLAVDRTSNGHGYRQQREAMAALLRDPATPEGGDNKFGHSTRRRTA